MIIVIPNSDGRLSFYCALQEKELTEKEEITSYKASFNAKKIFSTIIIFISISYY